MLAWLSANAVGAGALVAAITVLWSIVQFIFVRRRDQQAREFEVYHLLIKELVSPTDATGVVWLDRQIAAIFELRNFPRYYELTARLLKGMKDRWSVTPQTGIERLSDEIDRTLAIIRHSRDGIRGLRILWRGRLVLP